MKQLDLEEAIAEQEANLARVFTKIAPAILEFHKRVGVGGEFHMADLTAYVRARTEIAPDSAGRIMRCLRQDGALNYEVVNRRQSLYRFIEAAR